MAICKNCFNTLSHQQVKCSICNEALHKQCAIYENGELYCDLCYVIKDQDKNKTTFTIPESIRRSYIETYIACPYKFYLEVLKGIKEKDANIYAQIGIDLHTLFDKASQDDSYKSPDMFAEYHNIWSNYNLSRFADEEQVTNLKVRSDDCINAFYKILPTLPKKPFATEQNIIFDVGNELPRISTTSDRIDLINDELEMIDWKTGKVMVGQKISSDLQAPLYIYGVKQKYKLPVRKFTFYYLQEGKTRVFERIDEDTYKCQVKKREYYISLSDAIKKVQSIFAKIIKGQFNIPQETKKMYFTCKMCHLLKSNNCKGVDIQSWLLTQS